MKVKVRKGVFETNSSSTHSLTMCLGTDFDEWKKHAKVQVNKLKHGLLTEDEVYVPLVMVKKEQNNDKV